MKRKSLQYGSSMLLSRVLSPVTTTAATTTGMIHLCNSSHSSKYFILNNSHGHNNNNSSNNNIVMLMNNTNSSASRYFSMTMHRENEASPTTNETSPTPPAASSASTTTTTTTITTGQQTKTANAPREGEDEDDGEDDGEYSFYDGAEIPHEKLEAWEGMEIGFDELRDEPGYYEWSDMLPVKLNPFVHAMRPKHNNRLNVGEVDMEYLKAHKVELIEKSQRILEDYDHIVNTVEKTNNSFTNIDVMTMIPELILLDWRREGLEDDAIILRWLRERASMMQNFESKRGNLKPADVPYDNMRPYVDDVDRAKKMLIVSNIEVAEKMANAGFMKESGNLSKILLEQVQETGVDPRYHIRLLMNRALCDLSQGNMSPQVEADLLLVLKEFDRFTGKGGSFHKQMTAREQSNSKAVIGLELKEHHMKAVSKLVEMYALQGRFQDALDTLQSLSDSGVWYKGLLQGYRALIMASLGRQEEAIITLDEAKETLPKHRTVFQREFRLITSAVELLTKSGKVDNILRRYVHKITHPHTGIVTGSLVTGVERDRIELQNYASFVAQLQLNRGRNRDALKYNNLALKTCENGGHLTDEVPLLLVQKAEIHARMNDHVTAKRIFQTAINLSQLQMDEGQATDMISILSSHQKFLSKFGSVTEGKKNKERLQKLTNDLGVLNSRRSSVAETFIELSFDPQVREENKQEEDEKDTEQEENKDGEQEENKDTEIEKEQDKAE